MSTLAVPAHDGSTTLDTPAQDARCLAVGKTLMSPPVSAPLRAQFPGATSLSMSLSSSFSASNRFRRRFLLQRLQPHHILRPHRLELRASVLIRLHRDLQMPTDRVDVGSLGEQPIGLTELPHDLLRRMPLALHESHLLAQFGRS